jgi:hypothetical protein
MSMGAEPPFLWSIEFDVMAGSGEISISNLVRGINP